MLDDANKFLLSFNANKDIMVSHTITYKQRVQCSINYTACDLATKYIVISISIRWTSHMS